MTTAIDTRPELIEAPVENEKCCCIWWYKPNIQRQCPNDAQYEVIGHSFGGNIEPCQDGATGKVCQSCLDKALKGVCYIHNLPSIYSYTRL